MYGTVIVGSTVCITVNIMRMVRPMAKIHKTTSNQHQLRTPFLISQTGNALESDFRHLPSSFISLRVRPKFSDFSDFHFRFLVKPEIHL